MTGRKRGRSAQDSEPTSPHPPARSRQTPAFAILSTSSSNLAPPPTPKPQSSSAPSQQPQPTAAPKIVSAKQKEILQQVLKATLPDSPSPSLPQTSHPQPSTSPAHPSSTSTPPPTTTADAPDPTASADNTHPLSHYETTASPSRDPPPPSPTPHATQPCSQPCPPSSTSDNPIPPNSCPICQRTFANSGSLARHLSACCRNTATRQQAARPPPPCSSAPTSAPAAVDRPAISQATWETVPSWDWPSFFSPAVSPGPILRRIPSRIRLLILDALLIPLRRLAQHSSDDAAHLILLAFPRLLLRLPSTAAPTQSLTSSCASLARRFINGDWQSLFIEAVAAANPAARPLHMASARSTALQARLNRAKRFAKCGDWSRSLAALEAGELAPPSSETVAALSSKHPPAAEKIPDWVHSFTPAAAPQLTVPVLHAALQSAPRGTAAGPSGWFIEHLRDTFLSHQQHLPSLLHVFQNWLQGDLPPAVRPFYTASNLVALQKPHGGVRPIAIGEVLPRLLSRCITLLFKQQMRETFLPHLQFGVAIPAGIEIMSHAVYSAFSLHPDWVVLQLDVANAFNSFNRVSMFEALRRSPFSSRRTFLRTIVKGLPLPCMWWHAKDIPVLQASPHLSGLTSTF
ncbi:unnamed protein product [Closterium sp. NIES-54]